ncbi:hypothetical protein CYMTET_52123 [Cymbomonas tetramitiformis]|uniref:Uncharacterized protein n=1 Tax=Cymbomonas tetramitiformis TaxID=36881 RepID=A0AAE0BJU9_9CHLO|nr:hypothetical protein CYMTET_52123 [Cymbomonas tetramitiformis]
MPNPKRNSRALQSTTMSSYFPRSLYESYPECFLTLLVPGHDTVTGFAPIQNNPGGGTPYGFFPYGSENHFYIWVDINLSANRSQQLLQYLQDGLYLDANTKALTVQIITYNAELHYFCNTQLDFSFATENGGVIRIVSKIQTVNFEMYDTTMSQFRGALEVIYVVCVFVAAYIELKDLVMTKLETGSFKSYFGSYWNYFDLTSIALNLTVVFSWMITYFQYVRTKGSREPLLTSQTHLRHRLGWANQVHRVRSIRTVAASDGVSMRKAGHRSRRITGSASTRDEHPHGGPHERGTRSPGACDLKPAMTSFTMKPQYHVYTSLTNEARWLKLNENENGKSEEFDRVLDTFNEMNFLTDFQVTYMMLNGLNSFFFIIRLLKVCDFQPRMGILTRTIAMAASDLYHFFLLLLLIFMGYSITGHLVFGTTLKQFSRLLDSGYTLFNLMVFGDNSMAQDLFLLIESHGTAMGIVALSFYASYAMLVVLILLNFLLAIIVDAFTCIKESIKETTSLHEEIYQYTQNAVRQNIMKSQIADEIIVDALDDMQRAAEVHIQDLQGGAPESSSMKVGTPVEHEDEDFWENKFLLHNSDGRSMKFSGAKVRKTLELSSKLCHELSPGSQKSAARDTVVDISAKYTVDFCHSMAKTVMQAFGMNKLNAKWKHDKVNRVDDEQRRDMMKMHDLLKMMQMKSIESDAKLDALQQQLKDSLHANKVPLDGEYATECQGIM